MSIRKTGAVTGEVTEVEHQEGITATAAPAGWTPRDEAALADEDQAEEDPAE
jgi:hypothetical protein